MLAFPRMFRMIRLAPVSPRRPAERSHEQEFFRIRLCECQPGYQPLHRFCRTLDEAALRARYVGLFSSPNLIEVAVLILRILPGAATQLNVLQRRQARVLAENRG